MRAPTTVPASTTLVGAAVRPRAPSGDDTLCFEYTWWKGEIVDSANHSTVATYIQGKLKDFALGLGWVQEG